MCAGSRDSCFVQWLEGKERDNKGFLSAICNCGKEIAFDLVQRLMDESTFAVYDKALLLQCLLRSKEAVFCPGVDCQNAFVRPVAKGVSACRSTICECKTVFCVMCGEKWDHQGLSHNKLDCKNFKALLDKQSGVSEWRSQQPKRLVKNCPGCQRITEKNEGCNSHTCTACGTHFCWGCCAVVCRCREKRQRRRARLTKWSVRKSAANGGNTANGGNNNNNNVVVAVPVASQDRNAAFRPLVVDGGIVVQRASVFERPSRLDTIDLDVVVLNPTDSKALRIASELDDVFPLKGKKTRKSKRSKKEPSVVSVSVGLTKKDRRKLKKQAMWVKV